MIPEAIAHYTITSKLGEGGMGEVWRATDTKLGREVAIKILPEAFAQSAERLARFGREAQVLASLNHPNIAAIHGVEDRALILELVEGPTLADRLAQGGLPVEEVVSIARQIAEALEYAHGKGVIHRDLKPANIKAGARVKVLDFGLAKVQAVSDPGDVTVTAATQAGAILGTAAYMSPEQAAGRPVDERSDIFAFGVLLYEMLSGLRAFPQESAVLAMAAILHTEPRPLHEIAPQAPEALESIVARCLAKDPQARFASMAAVRHALEAPWKPSESASIAVLPFTNLSADKENEYFSDGLAEEILNALSQVEGLRVAARTSSFSFKGKNAEMSEIASKLRVANLLEGSVRRAGARVRVTVQLIDARNGFQLWSERYDRQMEDLFEVQDEIARAIAERLKVTLSGGVKQSTKNVEAYELYLKGRHFWHQRSPSGLRTAIECFEKAIQLDPQYALAYSGLADCYGILQVYGWARAEVTRPPAQDALKQAVALGSSLWEVNFSRGFYTLNFERSWRSAEPHFQKAIAINPRSPLAHSYYGVFLAMDGRADEAIERLARAAQLDPLAPFIRGITATALFVLGRFDAAERAARQAIELQPGYLLGLWFLGLSLLGLERHEEAVQTFEQIVAISRAPYYIG